MSKRKFSISLFFLVLSIGTVGLDFDKKAECATPPEKEPVKKSLLKPIAAAKAALHPVNAARAAKEKITNTLKPDEPAVVVRDKWALLVGLEAFNDDTIRPVKNAQNNASLLSQFLASPDLGKFGQSRVVIVTNNKATRNNVAKALGDTWLLKNALPNDLIILYFCTRAQRKADGSDLLLYMFDTPASQPELGSIELKATLANLQKRTQSKQILCLLDLAPLNKQKNADDADEPAEPTTPDDATKITLQQIAQETGTTILSSTMINGKSYPSSTKPCSAFIEQLLEGLATSGGQVEFDQVAQYVQKMVTDKVALDFRKQQVPIFATSDAGAQMLKTVVGIPVKSSTPKKIVNIGHPVDTTGKPSATQQTKISSISRSVSNTSTKPKQEEKEDDDSYDGATFSNVDFGAYMDKMKKDIQAKWKPPKGFKEQKIVTVFSIKKDGTIANASIADGSGVETVDQSALEALQAASPLDPLPTGSPPYVQMRYVFEWKVTKN
ncbi:MAG: TonB family protein [Candidatus Melainabacteria bacterium]|nr:TonB family protein [Candidatus Melainabacteria bacterium]